MSNRSLNGISVAGNRTLNGLVSTAIEVTGEKPVIVSDNNGDKNITIDISTLDSATLSLTNNLLVQQGTLLKQTTLNNLRDLIAPSVEYDLPIVFGGNTISFSISGLDNATLALSDNVFVQQGTALKKTTFTIIKELIAPSVNYNLPLVLSGNTISFSISGLGNATLALSDNIFVQQGTLLKKTTFTDIKNLIDTNTQYTVASPLELSAGNQISLNQALLGNTTIVRVQCDRFNNSNTNAIMLYTAGTDILTIGNNAIANLKFNQKAGDGDPQTFTLPTTGTGGELELSISVSSPLSKSGNNIDLDFTDLINVTTLAGSDEFLICTDGVKTFRHITFSTLIVQTQANLNFPSVASVAPIVKFVEGNITTISYDMDTMTAITDAQVGDSMLLHAGTLDAPNYLNRKMTGIQLTSYIAHKGINFGTNPSAHINIGNTTYQTRIAGNAIYLNNFSNGEIIFQGQGNIVKLYLLEDSGSLVRSNGRNIAGYFQTTAKVILGNSTDNTEVFGNNIEITGGVATAGSSNVTGFGGFSRRLYSYNRGLYLYQSPWGGSGDGNVGRASWLITCGFQQFRLEFLITSTGGSLEILAYINGNGQYIDYSFTGQHKSKTVNDTIYDNIEDYVGLICYATGEYSTYDFDNETCNTNSEGITINDSMPIIDLCNTKKDKRVYGVISNKEDTDREMGYGRFVSKLPNANDANRVVVNGIGEGAIWIVNTNGNLENGDYIQTSNVPGYGEKQDDDLLHNYTVAKITCDCDFDMLSNKYRSKMIGDNIACFVGAIYYCG
jgi:hypothetical protein